MMRPGIRYAISSLASGIKLKLHVFGGGVSLTIPHVLYYIIIYSTSAVFRLNEWRHHYTQNQGETLCFFNVQRQ